MKQLSLWTEKTETAVELSNQILEANRELAAILSNPSTRNPNARIEAIRSLQLRIEALQNRLAAI